MAERPCFRGSFPGFEQRNACGKAVQAVVAADRANLALREESSRRDRADGVPQAAGVVAGLGKQPRTTAVATEDEGADRRCTAAMLAREQGHQIVVCTFRVADVELDRLTCADEISHRDHA